MSARRVKVATVQAEPAWLDAAAGVDLTLHYVSEAAAAGADLVAFPEVWIPGYPHFLWLGPVASQMPFIARYHEASLEVESPEMKRIREAARRHGIAVLLGFSERSGRSLYIAQTLIGSDGEVLLHRRKLKPTHVERSLFGEGDGSDLQVVDSPLGRIGALNCAEHLQPLSKYAMYAQNEEIHIASWPCFGLYRDVAYAMSSDANMAATQVYALEGGCYAVAATQVISEAGIKIFATTDEQRALLQPGGGCSRVYGPDGARLTGELPETQEGLVFAELDLALIALAKNAFDPAGHYARADATQLVHDRRPRRPVCETGELTPRADVIATLDEPSDRDA